jgi:hypothetical protein
MIRPSRLLENFPCGISLCEIAWYSHGNGEWSPQDQLIEQKRFESTQWAKKLGG